MIQASLTFWCIYQRLIEDIKEIIEVYKILTDKNDNSIISKLGLNEFSKRRGNNLKLNILEAKHELRKYSFCVRVPKIYDKF